VGAFLASAPEARGRQRRQQMILDLGVISIFSRPGFAPILFRANPRSEASSIQAKGCNAKGCSICTHRTMSPHEILPVRHHGSAGRPDRTAESNAQT